MKQIRVWCFLALLLTAAALSEAQEFNSVPLDHVAYEIIEMGVMRGIILPPPAAKPWSIHVVKAKLWEMIYETGQGLSADEEETVVRAFDSFERTGGFELKDGRYRAEGIGYSFEAGFGWESNFSVEAPGGSIASVNMAKLYANGDIADFMSWNVTALGEFLYIQREEIALFPRPVYGIPAVFPYAFSKQWDGGVLSPQNANIYTGWPDDPSFAYGAEGEVNGVFFDQLLRLRLGRLRHDWGYGVNGISLFLNSHARPFGALEGSFTPLSWLNISFLGGALEHFREDSRWTNDGQWSNMLTAAQVEFNPLIYVHFGIGAAAVLVNQRDAAVFADLAFRLPGVFTLWGSLFVDRLNTSFDNFSSMNGNSYAFQAGVKTVIHWLPLAVFTLHYTKVEPYCYSAFKNGGESLGYYLPPNSDELLLRFESMLFPDINAHIQFQMIRHGADFGDRLMPGSSPYDTLDDERSFKSFLKDGVYRWDNVIKIGGSFNLKALAVPLSIYMETGVVLTHFTVNGEAGIGNEADYEPLNDPAYRAGNHFVFSIGFRLFP